MIDCTIQSSIDDICCALCWIIPFLGWLGHTIYDFQPLIAGLMAFGIAWYALKPVYRQLHMAQVQMAISTREVLIGRLEETERRSRAVAAELVTITRDFYARLYQNDPEGSEPDINSHWAHNAEQIVSRVIESLRRQQISKADTQIIDDKRAAVIEDARVLEDCLRDIHQPDSIHLDDEDYGFSPEQIPIEEAKLAAAYEAACATLVKKIKAVADAAKYLDNEFQNALTALRERIRQINDLILKEDQTVKR